MERSTKKTSSGCFAAERFFDFVRRPIVILRQRRDGVASFPPLVEYRRRDSGAGDHGTPERNARVDRDDAWRFVRVFPREWEETHDTFPAAFDAVQEGPQAVDVPELPASRNIREAIGGVDEDVTSERREIEIRKWMSGLGMQPAQFLDIAL